MIPKLMYSEITGTIYIVTKYKDHGNGNYESQEKHDVTDQFNDIVMCIADDDIEDELIETKE